MSDLWEAFRELATDTYIFGAYQKGKNN